MSNTTDTGEHLFELHLDEGSRVTIGDGHAEENRIRAKGRYCGQGRPTVRVTVTVRCGQDRAALLGSRQERINVTGEGAIVAMNRLEPEPAQAGTMSWQSDSAGVLLDESGDFIIVLSDFDCRTMDGDAEIEVAVEVAAPPGDPEDPALFDDPVLLTLKVPKTLLPSAEPKVHYFIVDPDYVLHAGSTPVTVSFLATGFGKVSLYRNNQKVKYDVQDVAEGVAPLPVEGTQASTGTFGLFRDQPSITTTYRLVPMAGDTPAAPLNRTVQVLSPGWNRLALPQGYPTRLFAAPDFDSMGREPRLYAIFVDSRRRAALHSSATGLDDWVAEQHGDVPRGMETSPGVAYKGRLWLIGGSGGADNPSSRAVYSYGPDEGTTVRRWRREKDPDESFAPRVGHACLVVPVQRNGVTDEVVWVLGGYDNGKVLDDIWSFDGSAWTRVRVPPEEQWPARWKCGAAVRRTAHLNGSRGTEVWIYGGVGPSRKALTDIHVWSSDTGKWTRRDTESAEGPGMAPRPEPGTALAVALAAAPAPSDRTGSDDRLLLCGTFRADDGNISVSRLLEWQGDNNLWESHEVGGGGWERFQGTRFYMQAFSFNQFLYVWSLHPRMDDLIPPPRLNILIP